MFETKLCDAAISTMENAYSPYSKYKVGAAVITTSGKVYTGCNVENASYSATVCAERNAVFKAISEGETDFEMLAVVASKNGKIIENFPPCGVCRQVLSEFCKPDFKILLIKNKEQYDEYKLSELLPLAFKGEKL